MSSSNEDDCHKDDTSQMAAEAKPEPEDPEIGETCETPSQTPGETDGEDEYTEETPLESLPEDPEIEEVYDAIKHGNEDRVE